MKEFQITNFKSQILNSLTAIANWKLEIKNLKFNRGQTLIELILAMGLAALIFPALFTGFITSREGRAQQEQRLQAIALLKETEQAVKSIRNTSWNAFATNGTYHPVLGVSTWTLVAGTATVNGLTQQIVISDVNRNSTGDIVLSGGTTDPSTKKAEITVSWSKPFTSSITSTMYFTRATNITYTDSSFNQLNSGITNGVIIATSSGSPTDGQVQLGAGGGGGDWCQPSFLIDTVDLPKSGVANAIAAIAGPGTDGSTIFAGTGDNASGVSFAKVDLPGNPPVASIPATFDGYKTNAVFGESNYGYLTTDNNSKEVVIMDLTQYSNPPTNSKYLEVGSINLPGSVNGVGIFVTNNRAYVTSSDNKFYIYNVSNKASPTLINEDSGILTLGGQGKKVLVVGDYAYIATGSTTYQMEIVDIDDAESPSIVGRLNLGTGQSGIDLYVNTSNTSVTRAYLVTSSSVSHNEFYIVNVSNKASPNITGLSSYDTGGMTPTGVTVVTGNRAIIVGTGGSSQYQVLNIASETNPLTACGTLTYATGIRGVASVLQEDGYAYSYVITGDASSELKVILGGGGSYSSTGIFESAIYDPGFSVAYNRFVGLISQPSQTTLQMQIAVAPPVSGSCTNATFNYVGPGGDPLQFYTPVAASLSATIPFGTYGSYQNPERCLRYKLWFSTTDSTQTPIFYDATLNYSP